MNSLLIEGMILYAPNDAFSEANHILLNVQGALSGIFNAVAVVCVLICAFRLLTAGTPQEVSTAKHWLITIAVAMLIFNLAPDIVNGISNFIEANKTGSMAAVGHFLV